MLNNAVLIENLIEDLERAATIDHIVFRDDLKPIDHRLLREDVIVVWHSQADADSVVGESIEAIGRHVYSGSGDAKIRAGDLLEDRSPTRVEARPFEVWSRRWRKHPGPCRRFCLCRRAWVHQVCLGLP